MRNGLLQRATMLAALISSTAAAADDKGNEDIGKRAQDTKPPQAAVLVNGALAVPGAPTNSQTVPAKFSRENDANDKLPTWGHTFYYLSPDQRHAIYQSIAGRGAAGNRESLNPETYAVVGAVLPDGIRLQPPPEDMAGQIPDVKWYMAALIGDKAVLVEPASKVVVGVFPN